MENFARATMGQFRKKTRTELLSDYVSRMFERIVPFEKRDSLKP